MRTAFLVLFVLGACHHEAATVTNARSSPSPGGSTSASAAASSASPSSTGAGPSATAIAIVDLGGGRFEVDNAGPAAARLQTVAAIESKTDTGWTPLPLDLDSGYRLVDACPRREAPLDTCVDLAAASAIVPVRWTGFTCSAQCNGTCHANPFAGPGTFRLVVRTCDGTVVDGVPFEMPSARDPTALDRWTLATNVTSGAAMRLDLPARGGFDAAAASAPDRVAGFDARAGTEHAIDRATLEKLSALVASASGFDDRIVKRCAVRHLVGVRIVRDLPATGQPRTETVEMALDFACQKFFAAFGEPPHRTVVASHFDPSRRAFVAWAKIAFPGDAELAKLE